MRRFIIHLIVAVITFSIGVIVERVPNAYRQTTAASMVQKIEPAAPEPPEPATASSPIQPAPELIFDYNPEEFNPRGDYYIVGRKPKDFREFDSFELAVSDDNGIASGVGRFQTYSEQMYSGDYSVAGWVTKKRLTFVATPVSDNDYVYTFDGRFLREGILADPYRTRVVLEGKLIKTKGCVKIAECEVKFRVEYLGC
jgi:hypothetical protein